MNISDIDLEKKIAESKAVSLLNSNLTNLVKSKTFVITTDNDGDRGLPVADIPQSNIIVSVAGLRDYGESTYTNYFSVIPTISLGQWSVKCIKDDMTKLSNTKVAIKVFYI